MAANSFKLNNPDAKVLVEDANIVLNDVLNGQFQVTVTLKSCFAGLTRAVARGAPIEQNNILAPT